MRAEGGAQGRSSPRWRSTPNIPSYWWATIGDASLLKLSPNLRKGTNDVERLEAIVDVALKGDAPDEKK